MRPILFRFLVPYLIQSLIRRAPRHGGRLALLGTLVAPWILRALSRRGR